MTNNITSQDYNQDSSTKLYLPKYCILEAPIRENTEIPDAAKIYFGELAVLASKYNYIPYTDNQLAEMKSVCTSTIKKWHEVLEQHGFITRETKNELIPGQKCQWIKKRKIYLNQNPNSKNVCGSVKNYPSMEGVKNYPSDEGVKNYPISNKTTNETRKQDLSVVDGPVRPPPLHEIKYKGKDAKENSINESEVLAYGIRTKKNWRIDEITYALNALAECKAVIYDVWRFIEGTIENHKRTLKGAFICKTTKTSSDSKSKESGIRSKSSEAVIEERVSPNSTFIPKTFREAFPDFPFGPRVLRTS